MSFNVAVSPIMATQPFTNDSKFNVMISYSHQDSELMLRIRDLLTANGFDVWVDTKLKGGTNFFKNIGSAVIGCDIFIFILSESSVTSRFCQDEVSLARISSKKILPITYCKVGDVVQNMDAGLRLILSCVQWICLNPKLNDNDNDRLLITSLNDTLHTELSDDERLENYHILYSDEDKTDPEARYSAKTLRRENSLHLQGFWTRNFRDATDEVPLKDVLGAIKKDYTYDYNHLHFTDPWALKALALWCFDLERNAVSITRDQYDQFVFPDGKKVNESENADSFWVRCKDGFSVRLSMMEVFNAHSSVRYDSIQNLSKIKNKRVLLALYKLLRDSEPNIRAVACISLALTGNTSPLSVEKVVKLLQDDDRLVRESACLALAKFKSPDTVSQLLQIWRNDVISDVRGAAVKALEAIGTPEAEEGMRVVKTLQEEFNNLSLGDHDAV